jgi:hypothetical protein
VAAGNPDLRAEVLSLRDAHDAWSGPLDRPCPAPPPVPEGLVHSGGDWIYSEWADGGSVLTIGMEPEAPAAAASAAAR